MDLVLRVQPFCESTRLFHDVWSITYWFDLCFLGYWFKDLLFTYSRHATSGSRQEMDLLQLRDEFRIPSSPCWWTGHISLSVHQSPRTLDYGHRRRCRNSDGGEMAKPFFGIISFACAIKINDTTYHHPHHRIVTERSLTWVLVGLARVSWRNCLHFCLKRI